MLKRYSNAPARAKKNISKTPLCLLTGVLFVFGLALLVQPAQHARAATSNTLNFQARLLTSSGTVVPDGNYHIEFKIYDSASAGASAQGTCSLNSGSDDCWWMETRSTGNLVRVVNGYFSVNLGSVTAFGSSIPWDQQLYLTMNIGGTGGSPSWDGEMLASGNRIKLTAVPYAFTAGKLQSTDSGITNSLVFATPSGSNKTLTLPNETGTVCTTGSVCSNYAPSTGGSGYIQNGTSVQTGANFAIQSTGTTNVSALIKQNTSQTADLLQLQDSSSNITAGFNSTGGLYLGRASGLTGSIKLYNSANANAGTLQIASFGQNSTITIPDPGAASDTVCLQTLANCGSAGVTLQQAYTASTGGTTPEIKLDSTRTGLDIQDADTTTGANLLNVRASNGSGLGQVLFGVGNTGATIFQNSSNSTSAFQIQNAAGTNIFNVDTTNSLVGTVATATASTNSQDFNLRTGNATGATSNSGSLKLDVGTATGTTGSILIGTVNNASGITLGSTTQTAAITLGQSTASNTISIGSAAGGGNTQTINIGTSSTAGSVTAVTMGSLIGSSTTLIQGGTGASAITLAQGVGGTVTVGAVGTSSAVSIVCGTGLCGIGNNATDHTTTVGSVTGTSATTLQGGTGGVQIGTGGISNTVQIGSSSATSSQTINIATNGNGTGTQTVNIGGNVNTNTAINIVGGQAGGVNIGSIGTATAGSTVHIADTTNASGTQAVTIGSNAKAANSLILQGGTTGGIGLNGPTTVNGNTSISGSYTFTVGTGTTTLGGVLNANGNTILGDATTDRLTINAQLQGGSPLVLQGATDNTYTTTIALVDPTANNTITLPNESGTVCTTGSICAGYTAAPVSGSYLKQVPATTAENTVTPTANSVVGLTVNGTSGTAATALAIAQSGASVAQTISLTNTSGTQTAGLSIDRNGAGGTTTSLIALGNSAGTATNGLLFSGTIGTDITSVAARSLSIITGTTGALTLDSGTTGNVNLGTNSNAKTIAIGNTTGATAVNLRAGSGYINFDSSTAQFTEVTGTRTLGVQARSTNIAGTNLTVAAGNAGAGGSAFQGGVLTLQGGNAAGTGNANGGGVTITGGNGTGTGVTGTVLITTPTFSTATQQNCASNCTVTQSSVDGSGGVLINATSTNLTVTLPDPTILTAGKIVYVTAVVGSNDFTLSANGGGSGNLISMKANTSATMIWNGSDWTAAGASSSTTLQAAYNNTLTAAGGAEIVLNPPGGAADGLTIRNNATTPIIGSILEAQTSVGSNLFSVNNNATEYANNGGAEDPTFTMWTAAPAGGTISRYTTAGDNIATGQASVFVDTTATANTGVRNTLSAALTNNLTYTVSYAVRHTSTSSTFTTLDTVYSRDGTNTGTTACDTGSTATNGIWTRITCTFTVPSSGVTASNAIFMRHSDAAEHDFYIDNLSVTVSANVNYAVDGSVDSPLGTNWTAFGAGTAVTLSSTELYDTSGSVKVDTTNNTDRGVTNNMAITPSVSTQYLVTFYAKLGSGTFTDVRVRYSRDGGTSFASCVDYNTRTLSTSSWTKITCLFTTDGTTASNPDLIIDQPTAPGGTRTFYVDALTVSLNNNNASNVQVGGGSKGGPTTLFTLDRASAPPIAANNDAYLGSMYYDTVTGRIQCYEADGWGACGAPPDNVVNLNPEYAGAVLNGSGIGTMTADFCSNDAALSVNTSFCATGEAKNFYHWTSPQATQQTYSIYVTYQLPATFNSFASDDTVKLTARVDNTTNASVTYEMFKSTGGAVTKCGSGETNIITGGGGSANTWYTYGINGNEATGCSFTSSSAGNFVIFKINLKSNSNANAYVSTLSFTTTGK